jgi:hypothetical protein
LWSAPGSASGIVTFTVKFGPRGWASSSPFWPSQRISTSLVKFSPSTTTVSPERAVEGSIWLMAARVVQPYARLAPMASTAAAMDSASTAPAAVGARGITIADRLAFI